LEKVTISPGDPREGRTQKWTLEGLGGAGPYRPRWKSRTRAFAWKPGLRVKKGGKSALKGGRAILFQDCSLQMGLQGKVCGDSKETKKKRKEKDRAGENSFRIRS